MHQSGEAVRGEVETRRSAGARPLPRVVVAGMGAVTAHGLSVESLWAGVSAGAVAIRPLVHLSTERLAVQIGGEVVEACLPVHRYPHPPEHRDRVFDFTLMAAEEAMQTSGVRVGSGPRSVPAERWAVVVGTSVGGLQSAERWFAGYLGRSAATGPALLPLAPPQALAEAVSAAFRTRGPTLTLATACATGANVLGYTADLIRFGYADAALAGGSDAITDVLFAGFGSLEALSPTPSAPFARSRRGLSIGEGSGMLVLLREDTAHSLGVPVLAEVAGYGLSADGYHPTAPQPDGAGAARAIRAALDAAGATPGGIGYVNAHGTGTLKNDEAETRGVRRALGAAADRVPMSSTKSMIGHLLGAAGAVEAIVTVKALEAQVAPPTANYDEADPECDMDYVPHTARPVAMEVVLSNNFGFGGANASLVIARPGALEAPHTVAPTERVVITGLGAVSPAGPTAGALWQAFADGRVCTHFRGGIWSGRFRLDPSPFLTPRERRRMDRLSICAVMASTLALRDAAIRTGEGAGERIGVLFGTGMGPMESMEQLVRPLLEEGPGSANPAIFPNTVYNAAAGYVAMQLGVTGPTSTVTAGHAAGAVALQYAYDLVASRRADAMLCLAADTLTDVVLRAHRELGLLYAGGDGLALSEGGFALLLESLSSAQARHARIYGEVLGCGMLSDARGIGRVDPHGGGVELAMRLALERACLTPGDVSAVWANAAGQMRADTAEMRAIERLFHDSWKPCIVTPKLRMGEPVGAGGPLNAILALECWARGSGGAHVGPVGPVLVNSSSLGGAHVSVALAPYGEAARKGPVPQTDAPELGHSE